MPNQTGANQFGGAEVQPQYGDVKKQSQLTRSAPMSGAQVATKALQAPRRSGKQATRPQAAPEGPMPVAVPPGPQGTPPASLAEIAQIPGASPLVQMLFSDAS